MFAYGSFLVEVEAFADGPAAELVEEDVSAMICVDFAEDHLRVRYVHSEAFKHWDCGLELLKSHPAILARIDAREGLPVLVVLSQVQHQELELCLGDVVIAVRVGGFEFVLGSVEGADDDWLKSEEGRQFHNIFETLIDLGQAQVAVAVDVDIGPVFEPPLLVLGSVANGQLGLDLFPNLLRCHILSVYKLPIQFHLSVHTPSILI